MSSAYKRVTCLTAGCIFRVLRRERKSNLFKLGSTFMAQSCVFKYEHYTLSTTSKREYSHCHHIHARIVKSCERHSLSLLTRGQAHFVKPGVRTAWCAIIILTFHGTLTRGVEFVTWQPPAVPGPFSTSAGTFLLTAHSPRL